jgi:predicted DNA-binding transcriptional regulator AlpA
MFRHGTKKPPPEKRLMSPENPQTRQLLTTREVAEWLQIDQSTIEFWRSIGRGPSWSKLSDGPNSPVRYHRGDVERWLAERRVKPKVKRGRTT